MRKNSNNFIDNPENRDTEPQMLDDDMTPDIGGNTNIGEKNIESKKKSDEPNGMRRKSIEAVDGHDDNNDTGAESDVPEIISDAVVIPLEVEDEVSIEMNDNHTEAEGQEEECHNVSRRPTEFVIVSTASGSTVKFPDDVQIKDELAEPIATSCEPNEEEALENDPMDLLEINERSDVNSSRSNVDNDDGAADDISSTGSSSVQTTSSTVNISEWSKDYPWLLHEEADEWYGYCLYCDVKLSVRSVKSAKHHGLSLYHRERCENYLAFCEEEEKNNLRNSVIEIKEEYGTDSYVAALKLKRKSQAESFNNYNWNRWLKECSWLERDSPAGTIGVCKYCSIRLNVEFKYLRQRHQESGQHKEKAKLNKSSKVRKSFDGETEEKEEDITEQIVQQEQAEYSDKSNEQWFLETIDNGTARCILCDTLIKMSSFKRHLLTQIHLNNEKNTSLVAQMKAKKNDSLSTIDNDHKTVNNNWELYKKLHSWLIPDPVDPTYAYCKYCKKRLQYGSSAAKRALHEHSFTHKANERTYNEDLKQNGQKQDSGGERNAENDSAVNGDGGDEEEEDHEDKSEDDEDEEEEEEENGEEENSEDDDDEDEDEENSEEQEDDNDDEDKEEEDESSDGEQQKKRILSTQSEWFSQYPWCKRYKKDPKCCYCSYCKIPICKTSRKKHSFSKRHRAAESKVLKAQGEKSIKQADQQFAWSSDIKGHPHLYYCKYCRVRISRNYSKKQHSFSKIHLINEKLYLSKNKKKYDGSEAETKVSQPATPTPSGSQLPTSSSQIRKVVVKGPSFIASIKQWQKRFSWLGYKLTELRSNYAYCKACEQSLYVRSFKNVIKHQRSSKHIRILNQLQRDRKKEKANENKNNDDKNQAEKKTTKQEDIEQNVSATAAADANKAESNNISFKPINSSIESLQKRYSWVLKSAKADHAHCQYCNADVPLTTIYLRNHTNSRAHRRAVVNFGAEKTKTEQLTNEESNTAGNEAEDDDLVEGEGDGEADDDVVMITENAEEILISEQDDDWTVKPENMDEHEALDRLLQQRSRKIASSNNIVSATRAERKLPNTSDDRPSAKRFKKSHTFRSLNESANSSIISSILATPLTLASCLGPLIQQQIQQVTNCQQSAMHSPASASTVPPGPPSHPETSKEPENTYDLFFKSVSETLKKLPVDLAAEGKLKVMQIVCDLELKALKRKQEEDSNSLSSSMNTLNSNILENTFAPMSNPNYNQSNVATSSLNLLNSTKNRNPGEDQSDESNSRNAGENLTENNTNANTTNTPNTSTTTTDRCLSDTVITITGSSTNQRNLANCNSNTANPTYTTPAMAAMPKTNDSNSKDNNRNPNHAPLIGVMDMNGLQTLQLRNTNQISKQVPPKQKSPGTSTNNNNTTNTGVPTAIRCIPFKNLSQHTSADPNSKVPRINAPSSMLVTSTPTSQSSHQQTNTTPSVSSTPKGLLNLRNIHVTTRRVSQPATSISVSMMNSNKEKSHTPPTYVQAAHTQNWSAVNGSSIHTVGNNRPLHSVTTTTAKTSTSFQVFAKQQQQQNHSYRQYK